MTRWVLTIRPFLWETELIENEVRKEFNIPSNWKMIAQMPFGKGTAPAGEKEFSPIENRVKIMK